MIIMRLNGGLGNQMFQYAFCKVIAEKFMQQIIVDFSQFQQSNRKYSLNIFDLGLKEEYCLDTFKGYKMYHLRERKFEYDMEILETLDDYNFDLNPLLISGYWQSYKYFDKISDKLKHDFHHIYKVQSNYSSLLRLIQNKQSVMVHIRRGDYLIGGNLEKHGVVDMNYIQTAIDFYRDKLLRPTFFIFSDDIEWCLANMDHQDDIVFVDEDGDEGLSSFSLMRHCKYFVISNSTFSWWAAWLGDFNKKYVISPKEWFQLENVNTSDLIPCSWRRM